MRNKKKKITVAIDSPAAAGAGTQAKLIAKEYNLFQLDTGRIYRLIGKMRLDNPKTFNYKNIKKRVKRLKIKDLQNKKLLSDRVAISASIIAKNKKIRKIVHQFQVRMAYSPPKKFSGSVLDGRDITSIILKDAMFKFFITANINTRAKRRFKEYKKQNKKISFNEVLKNLKNRDKSDRTRKFGPLKKTKDSILINSTKLSRRQCFLKIKAIMDRKLYY
tara:strand:- start:743 stop:1399 length:657 start_codon:yes stop_codon:yes gene_type:complete